jgi:ribosomal protein S18 acetylase RimI-like enzyme
MQDLKLREARRGDVDDIVMVANSSITEGEDAGFGGPTQDSPFKNAARLSDVWLDPNSVGNEEIFVAEIDGQVVGVVSVEDRGAELEVVDIDVTMRFQNRGVGTRLVEYVEDIARQRGKVTVTLGTSRNAEGVAWKSLTWWQSRGYDVTHEEENVWTRSISPRAREIRMRKRL